MSNKMQDDESESGYEKVKIESMTHFESFMNSGYEITKVRWNGSEAGMVPTLILQNGEKKLLVDCAAIDDHIAHLQAIYDIDRKKQVFVWVPDTNLYFDLQERFFKIIYNDHNMPIDERETTVRFPKIVHDSIISWFNKNANLNHKTSPLSKLFFEVCIIRMKEENVQLTSLEKDSSTLAEINKILSDSSNFDHSIALSFFYLAEKYNMSKNAEEILVGAIIYDLNQKRTLSFNIQSVEDFYKVNRYTKKSGLFSDILLYLLNRSIDAKCVCRSFLPLPVHSPWYTALPWFSYVALNPIRPNTTNINDFRNLTIPEFFVFGYSEFIQNGNSFTFDPFSSDKSGRATCILKFNDGNRKISYTLRFDQWRGDTKVHLDYDAGGVKMIEHYDLDMEAIYNYNPDLFVAALAASMFDGHFSTIIKTGLEGIRKLVQNNPAYLYPLNQVWILEKAVEWFNDQPERYQILIKFAKGEALTAEQNTLITYMQDNFLGVIAEENGRKGIGILGAAIHLRYERNQTFLGMTK